jgi:hypothetical protein
MWVKNQYCFSITSFQLNVKIVSPQFTIYSPNNDNRNDSFANKGFAMFS